MKKLFMLTILLLGGQIFAAPAKKEYVRKKIEVPAKKTAEKTKTPIAASKQRTITHSIDAIRKAVAQNSATHRGAKRVAPAVPRIVSASAAAKPEKKAASRKA